MDEQMVKMVEHKWACKLQEVRGEPGESAGVGTYVVGTVYHNQNGSALTISIFTLFCSRFSLGNPTWLAWLEIGRDVSHAHWRMRHLDWHLHQNCSEGDKGYFPIESQDAVLKGGGRDTRHAKITDVRFTPTLDICPHRDSWWGGHGSGPDHGKFHRPGNEWTFWEVIDPIENLKILDHIFGSLPLHKIVLMLKKNSSVLFYFA